MSTLPLEQITAALRAALSPEHQSTVPQLAQWLVAMAAGALAPDDAEQQLTMLPGGPAAVAALAGANMEVGNAAISFGEGVQSGDISIRDVVGQNKIELHVHLVGAPGAPASSAPFQVPYPPNPLFRGRDAELAELERVLLGAEGGTAAVLPAIAGTGGIGKTQLASEFAHAYRGHFPGGVFWLNMEHAENIASQVAAIGGPGGLEVPGWQGLSFDERVTAVQRAWNEPTVRLLVFDNLEDPKLLQQWRPRGGGARVLITTRRGVWSASAGVRPVKLQTLARAESIRLLLSPRFGDQLEGALSNPTTIAEADAICEQVGDLPLALALAGASGPSQDFQRASFRFGKQNTAKTV